jgi:glycosyltransferase involved in cell wall biosynthesis
MAAGLPVVATPVGMNCEMVVHGETGYLAETPDEWAEAIFRLAADPLLRQRLGQAGRRLVEAEYSVGRWSPRFAHLIDRLPHDAAGLPDDSATVRGSLRIRAGHDRLAEERAA